MVDQAEFRDAMARKDLQYQDLLQTSLEVEPVERVAHAVYKVALRWTIHHSNIRYSNQFSTVRSPVFRVGPHQARIVMFPMGLTSQNKYSQNKYMSLYVMPLWGVAAPIRGRLKLVVDGQPPQACQFEEELVGMYTLWGFERMCLKSAFVGSFCKGNRTVCVECTLTVESKSHEILGRHGDGVPGTLAMQDFSSILASGRYSDVTLSVEGEEMRAHRNVLSVRSPVFAAMFEADMLEANSGVVTISDTDVGTVKRLLRFLYTGEFHGSESKATRLLQAADKYGIDDLKLRCAAVLCHQVSKYNAVELLVLAERYQLKRLLKIAFRCIESRWMYIRTSDTWKTLKETRSELAFYVEALRSKEA